MSIAWQTREGYYVTDMIQSKSKRDLSKKISTLHVAENKKLFILCHQLTVII